MFIVTLQLKSSHGFCVVMLLLLLTVPSVRNLSIMQNVNSTTAHTAAAIRDIVLEYYVRHSQDFMLTVHMKSRHALNLASDLLSQLLPHLSAIKVQIETINTTIRSTYNRKHNLILIDDVEALRELNPAKWTKDYDFVELYLLYILQNKSLTVRNNNLIDVFNYFWHNSITHNVYSCRSVSVKILNKYNGTWINDLHKVQNIFPAKLLNLNNCTLRIALWHTPPYLSYFPNKTGMERIDHFEGELIKVIAKKLNFSLEFVVPPNDERRGLIFDNGTTTGAIKLLKTHVADISLGCFRLTLERAKILTPALPYHQTTQVYSILLSNRAYTSLEILSFPFDELTWSCICLILLVMFFTTTFIQYSFHKYKSRRTMLGNIKTNSKFIDIFATSMLENIKTNSKFIDIFAVFIGSSIKKAPRANFARCLFFFWCIYGLTLRTAYQSLLYKLLETDLYRSPPRCIIDLLADKYKLVMLKTTFDSVKKETYIEKGLIDVIIQHSTDDLNPFNYLVLERNIPLAAVSPLDFLALYESIHRKHETFYVLPEIIFSQQITMYFKKHSYLTDRFDKILLQLRSQGLINYWAQKSFLQTMFRKHKNAIVKPINLSHVSV
ncbi:uncharacterized protein LOC119667547 [Teleopsis dalmanni]|uniref:uncharacterized protein LOC119667547 n=1 Tax=Teleopsis dalmanni TaxID=139649 RepID=UPI0018CE0955|nr:uncharacterized protein LOC119667547 [Teleopsis dalmanni]